MRPCAALAGAVFLLHAAAALTLLVAYRTRVFTALCWYLALSGIPGAALLLQTCFIDWSTALLKSGDLWWSGRALFYALHLDLATPAGVWLRVETQLR